MIRSKKDVVRHLKLMDTDEQQKKYYLLVLSLNPL